MQSRLSLLCNEAARRAAEPWPGPVGLRNGQLIASLLVMLAGAPRAVAQGPNMDAIGVTLLRSTTTNLDGSGVRVAQAEGGAPNWEVNPAATGLPASLFTWYAAGRSTNAFPNSLGSDSGHANYVASLFYGAPGGVITSPFHVDSFEAAFLAQFILPSQTPINDAVVNQSYEISGISVSQQQDFDRIFDGYSALHGTLFISGVGSGGTVGAPATSYNGIGVSAYDDAATSVGPTVDNGRAKPDLSTLGGAGSFAAPLVSGAAALLIQAAARGDGGPDTNAAADPRTIKALLLNGVVKPPDWTNAPPSPLDPRYGAGKLNVFNSHAQLAAGRQALNAIESVPLGGTHPPDPAVEPPARPSGWDFGVISSGSTNSGVNHYYLTLSGGGAYTFTGTLVWNRQAGQNAINDLDLFLYEAASGHLVAASTSRVDNVEHLFVPQLPAGQYDLQVFKNGGAAVTAAETYAIAFDFFAVSLGISANGGQLLLQWPLYPANFHLQTAASLAPPVSWTNLVGTTVSNGQNTVTVDAGGNAQYFRLLRP